MRKRTKPASVEVGRAHCDSAPCDSRNAWSRLSATVRGIAAKEPGGENSPRFADSWQRARASELPLGNTTVQRNATVPSASGPRQR